MGVRKDYRLTLRTLAPVHIGSGQTYTAKEYIYENGAYYFPDMGKLYQEIEKTGPKMTAVFEDFLMQSGNRSNRQKPRLVHFLNDQKIKERDFSGYKIKETGFEQDSKKERQKGYINEISAFVKDSYGQPYIPGSSLKGAIRTILVNQHFHTDQIPNDLFQRIRVSDSQPIAWEQLILAQKWDYSARKEQGNSLPIHRECLKPLTMIEFTITAIGKDTIQLLDQLSEFAEEHYKHYHTHFLNDFPDRYIQDNLFAPIYLGAGSGFWTKTEIDNADPSRHQRGSSKMKMKGKGVLKLTKVQNIRYKARGEIRTLINNSENFYEMGKCCLVLKEEKEHVNLDLLRR